jgi:hypothetical protein
MRAGRNSITLGPSGNDLVRWSATQASTAAGDLGMNTTSGRPSEFVSSVAQDITNTAPDNTGIPGLGIYGSGTDGSITSPLGANTTIAAGERNVRFVNLDLAGFTLTASQMTSITAAPTTKIYVEDTLTMGSGTIVNNNNTTNNGTGGNGGGTGGGDGGQGADGRTALIVFAQNVSGTGTISAAGLSTASTGSNGAAPSGNNNGFDGGSADANVEVHGVQVGLTGGSLGGDAGNGNTNGNGGFARNSPNTNDTINSLFKDLLRYYWSNTSSVHNNQAQTMIYVSGYASGGGGGGQRTSDPGGGGASGGPGGTYGGQGGQSGAGGTGSSGLTTGGSGGGGGGGGSPGCLVYVVTESIASGTLTVTAAGGSGAAGGNGSNSQAGRGGGGGGGGGGVVLYIGPAGGSVTTTAAGGSGGAAGAGTGTGGAAGSTGTAGIIMEMEEES